MTFTVLDARVGNFTIEIYQVKYESTYHVALYEHVTDAYITEIDHRVYSTFGKALHRYNALVKKCEEE